MAELTPNLLEQAGVDNDLPEQFEEDAWVEVVQKMDAIYADLVGYQVELETKNAELEKAYRKLQDTHEALKRTQLRLVQSEKMASLGRLVAGVAHELNNPISFVYANMHALLSYEKRFQHYLNAVHSDITRDERETLRQELRVDRIMEDIRPLLEGSMEGAERVSEIVKNLRQFSTPANRAPESFDLATQCSRIVHWVSRSVENKPEMQLNIPNELMLVNYEGYIHQILVNLIQNAIDAMEDVEQPSLWVEANWRDDQQRHVVVTVRDVGKGIAEADLGKIFEPFFTTKPVGKGTGLGLYISYSLATEQCNGRLAAQNHPQGGAKFILTLPNGIVAEGGEHERQI